MTLRAKASTAALPAPMGAALKEASSAAALEVPNLVAVAERLGFCGAREARKRVRKLGLGNDRCTGQAAAERPARPIQPPGGALTAASGRIKRHAARRRGARVGTAAPGMRRTDRGLENRGTAQPRCAEFCRSRAAQRRRAGGQSRRRARRGSAAAGGAEPAKRVKPQAPTSTRSAVVRARAPARVRTLAALTCTVPSKLAATAEES
jgi:hypothetical protein